MLVVPEGERSNLSAGLNPDELVLTDSLRSQTLNYLNERKLLGVRIQLREPNYIGVAVRASIGLEPMHQNERAEEMIRQQLELALYQFLNPLTGGIDGEGWKFGRPVYISDIMALFQKIAGVRYIGEVVMDSYYKQNNTWVKQTSEPRQIIAPGDYGLICSWSESPNPGHRIHFISE